VSRKPERGAAAADLREIRSLSTIADERRVLLAQLRDGLRGPPQENIGRVRPYILRVAVNASFTDIDAAAALFRCASREGVSARARMADEKRSQQQSGDGERFMRARGEETAEHWQQDDRRSECDEPCRDAAEVLGHSDPHGGPEPAGNCIQPRGAPTSLLYVLRA
jgi:hypothetical protein